MLYEVSTLYFEAGEDDGFRKPGFSKERRLEPQITIGLLTDASGFPLAISAFEGNMAETNTMLPVIESFMTAHRKAFRRPAAYRFLTDAYIVGIFVRVDRYGRPSGV